jgi:hypothetical protein
MLAILRLEQLRGISPVTDGQRPGREPIAALAIALLLVALPAAGQQTAPDGGDASSAPLAETARGLIDPPPGPGQRPQILDELRRANRYFMQRWPDPGAIIVTNRARPSNIWTRAVYYEGLLALYQLDPRREYYDYAVAWGEAHDWGLRDGDSLTRDADNQAAGQIYLDLYAIDPQAERIRAIRTSIDAMLASDRIDDWNWIDALGQP